MIAAFSICSVKITSNDNQKTDISLASLGLALGNPVGSEDTCQILSCYEYWCPSEGAYKCGPSSGTTTCTVRYNCY